MTEVKRVDVAFDMCPTCRGVWLDPGELEKIIAGAKDERASFEQDRAQFYDDPDAYRRNHSQPQQRQQRQEYGERGERGGRYDDDDDDDQRGGRRRGGGLGLFNIFD